MENGQKGWYDNFKVKFEYGLPWSKTRSHCPNMEKL
jgi:hypothetical protein